MSDSIDRTLVCSVNINLLMSISAPSLLFSWGCFSCRSLWLSGIWLVNLLPDTCLRCPALSHRGQLSCQSISWDRSKVKSWRGVTCQKFTVGAHSCAVILNVWLHFFVHFLHFPFLRLGYFCISCLFSTLLFLIIWSDLHYNETIKWVGKETHALTYQLLLACHFRVDRYPHNKQSRIEDWTETLFTSICRVVAVACLNDLSFPLSLPLSLCVRVFVVLASYCWLTSRVQGLHATCRVFLQ